MNSDFSLLQNFCCGTALNVAHENMDYNEVIDNLRLQAHYPRNMQLFLQFPYFLINQDYVPVPK